MDHRQFCRVEDSYIYRMCAQPPAYNQIFSILFKMPCIISWKKPGLRRNDPSDSGNPDNPSMKMTGHCQIRPPRGIIIKIHWIVCQKNIVAFRFRCAKSLRQFLYAELILMKFLIISFIQFKTINLHLKTLFFKGNALIFQKNHTTISKALCVSLIHIPINLRINPHSAFMIAVSIKNRKLFFPKPPEKFQGRHKGMFTVSNKHIAR